MSNDKYIVMTAAACMPSSCWGTYRRVAVIETNGVDMPKQINYRHKAVVSIVDTWEKLNVGSTARCAYQRALVEARYIARELNAGRAC